MPLRQGLAVTEPTHAQYLRYLTYKGVRERYGVDIDDPQIQNGAVIVDTDTETLVSRIEHELTTIEKAGFPSYMLIVADILRFCREKNIPTGPGRGSICGSAVAYAIRITDVEPMRFGIPFERFLHLERIAQPDIDLDICQVRRQEVIEYLRETYGRDSVAQIITFTPLNAKGVVRDVCRVLHVDDVLRGVKSNETGEKLAGMIPEGQGADMVKLQEYMDSPEGKTFAETVRALQIPYQGSNISVIDTCLTLEGIRRHGSVHAAGVVIADRPLIEIAPLHKKNKDAEIAIQYDMRDAETCGLLKMDVLGLRTVTVIGEAERLIRQTIPSFHIKAVPLDDDRTFAMLSAGDTGSVFQLEGDGITNACKGMKPDRFEDVIDLIALYRPGPMEQLGSFFDRKHQREEITYAHPDIKQVLERTYGLIVYQEQVMGIVRTFGGYTAGEADMFRKAIGKKLVPLIKVEIEKFSERAIARGYSPNLIKEIGDQIFDFGRYGFNLGHATGYGFLTYWTAYLKANFPVEFFTANLNSHLGTLDRIGTILRDAEKHGIAVQPPDINESGEGFTMVGEAARRSIRFGIAAIKGIGDSVVRDILEERDGTCKNKYIRKSVVRTKDNGTPYKTSIRESLRVANVPHVYAGVGDFCARLSHIPINVKRALAMAGCFGSDIDDRRILLSVLDSINTAAKKGRPDADFDADPLNLPSELDVVRGEREVLGFYITQHPLGFYKADIERYGATIDGSLEELDSDVTIAGLVVAIRAHNAKNGEMAWVTLESGITDLPDITIFASVWPKVKDVVVKDAVIVVKGRKEWDARFGWGIKADQVIAVSQSRPSAKLIQLSRGMAGIDDYLGLLTLRSDEGVPVDLIVTADTRHAAIKTPLLIDPTGANIGALEEAGWTIHIDPPTPKPAASSFRGTNRVSIWDEPPVKLALRVIGGVPLCEIDS